MSSPQMPPWLQEQIMKLQQSQQNLQSIVTQRQHLEMEKAETEKALEELKKVADDDSVFKQAGTVLIKSNKKTLVDELEEKIELAKEQIKKLLENSKKELGGNYDGFVKSIQDDLQTFKKKTLDKI